MDPHPTAEMPVVAGRRRLDRARDVWHWALTPLLTLVLGVPAVACLLGLTLLSGPTGSRTGSAFCDLQASNGCEEATLSWLAEGTVIFAAVWALLWAIPWWRGLRTFRVVMAVAAVLVLAAVPMRLANPG